MDYQEWPIQKLIDAARRYKIPIAALTLLTCLVAALINVLILAPIYTAEASIYVLNRQSGDLISVNDLNSSAQLVNDYREIMMSEKVLQRVASSIGRTDLDGYEIDIAAVRDTRVMEIRVTGKSAPAAAMIANEIARESARTAIDIMQVESVSLIDEAVVPDSPSGPSRGKNIAIATLMALAAGIGLASLKEFMDQTLHTADDIERELGVAVLALVPNYESEAKRQLRGH